MDEMPEHVVQRQVDAYNAHDVDAFLGTYCDDAEYLALPGDRLLFRGAAEMRAQYTELFKRHPDVHVEVMNRISRGRFVIDLERVTGRTDVAAFGAVAIYQVEAGLIRRVWLIRG